MPGCVKHPRHIGRHLIRFATGDDEGVAFLSTIPEAGAARSDGAASGETASAGVAITVVAGSVPVVSVAPPAAAKQSANTALRLVGSASLDSASASQLELAWSCDGES